MLVGYFYLFTLSQRKIIREKHLCFIKRTDKQSSSSWKEQDVKRLNNIEWDIVSIESFPQFPNWQAKLFSDVWNYQIFILKILNMEIVSGSISPFAQMELNFSGKLFYVKVYSGLSTVHIYNEHKLVDYPMNSYLWKEVYKSEYPSNTVWWVVLILCFQRWVQKVFTWLYFSWHNFFNICCQMHIFTCKEIVIIISGI